MKGGSPCHEETELAPCPAVGAGADGWEVHSPPGLVVTACARSVGMLSHTNAVSRAHKPRARSVGQP